MKQKVKFYRLFEFKCAMLWLTCSSLGPLRGFFGYNLSLLSNQIHTQFKLSNKTNSKTIIILSIQFQVKIIMLNPSGCFNIYLFNKNDIYFRNSQNEWKFPTMLTIATFFFFCRFIRNSNGTIPHNMQIINKFICN